MPKSIRVILSSHILAEIREVCDYILIIAKGKLVASDTPENLENAMSGAGHVEIEVRRGKEEVAALLNHMASVKKAEYTLEEDGTLKVQIEARDGKRHAGKRSSGICGSPDAPADTQTEQVDTGRDLPELTQK